MDGHVKILGILHIALGALGVMGALACLMFFGGVAGLVGSVSGGDAEARVAVPVLGAIGGFLFILCLIFSAPAIIAGWGLLQYREWARILTLILCVLNLFAIPFGTVLGVYGLWVLLNQQTVALFRRAAMPAQPGTPAGT